MATGTKTDSARILLEQKKLNELCRHIRYVQDAASKIAEKLIENGEYEFARNLVANTYIHDQSKFRGIEWEMIGCRDPDVDVTIKKIAIKNHQETNFHHPEAWGGIAHMPEIFLAEMVCDCYARSVEFGTDLRGWFKKHAIEKYSIPKSGKVWKMLKKYLDMLLDEPF